MIQPNIQKSGNSLQNKNGSLFFRININETKTIIIALKNSGFSGENNAAGINEPLGQWTDWLTDQYMVTKWISGTGITLFSVQFFGCNFLLVQVRPSFILDG